MLNDYLKLKTTALADEKQMKCFSDVRITVLTDKLIRVEKGAFCDDPSFAVINRLFPPCNFKITEDKNKIIVETDSRIFKLVNGIPKSVVFKDTKKEYFFKGQKNLKGTARTLDGRLGAVRLSDGFLTADGVYLYRDDGVIINKNGKLASRRELSEDFYAFAYGKNYEETINAFYALSGRPPALPKWALGVWHSRYHAYSDMELLALLDRYEKEGISLTAVCLDMDWHYVKNLKEKFGVNYNGWTGWSWNKELFPKPRKFLEELHKRGLAVGLNLHPADGIMPFEDCYKETAESLGIKNNETIKFSCSDEGFINTYFDKVLKPLRDDGADFWWIDWQQGKKSDERGVDPLRALNHYSFMESKKYNERALILSRYAGAGSQRYPLGFSGDTIIGFKSLAFQPYFTANSLNAGYPWWSHDVGGHMLGVRSDELYLRWLQLSVFSPVLRLHSSNMELLGKEPWKYRDEVRLFAKKALSFRTRLIPYIYSRSIEISRNKAGLCTPLYYMHGRENNSYKYRNEFYFGSELLICPITKKLNKKTGLAEASAYIPDGGFTDIFTGFKYEGAKETVLLRGLGEIPVLLKSGGILPLLKNTERPLEEPSELEIIIALGNGSYTLFEDGISTKFEMSFENETLKFKVNKADGASEKLKKRSYFIRTAGEDISFKIERLSFSEEKEVIIENIEEAKKESPYEAVVNALSRLQGDNIKKELMLLPFKNIKTEEALIKKMKFAVVPKAVKKILEEYLARR